MRIRLLTGRVNRNGHGVAVARKPRRANQLLLFGRLNKSVFNHAGNLLTIILKRDTNESELGRVSWENLHRL